MKKIEWPTYSGFLGSAYKEYCSSSTVHGIKLPSGLPESAKLERPIFTPSTKAAAGEKDENVHPDKRQYIQTDRMLLVPHYMLKYCATQYLNCLDPITPLWSHC